MCISKKVKMFRRDREIFHVFGGQTGSQPDRNTVRIFSRRELKACGLFIRALKLRIQKVFFLSIKGK